ncbi:MAG: alpha/beta hydrolase [Micavibrio sp.]|nr:alpha/beta hydrolase [Micavibrio sp.]
MRIPNAQMQAILNAYVQLGPLPLETLTPAQARLMPLMDNAAGAVYGQSITHRAFAAHPYPVGAITHRLIESGDGRVMARIYTPKGEAPQGGWPAVVYFHGGGWVLGDLDTYDSSARGLCDGARAIVIAVQYRQAPEHKWPAAAHDAYAAFQWTHRNAVQLGIDPGRIAVAGESAGGNLAAVVSLMARDRDDILPVHQLLVYPVTDILNGLNSVSATENKEAKPLNTGMLAWFYGHYLEGGQDASDPYISPLYAKSHAGLPPATIILAQIDPLRSDGEAYAERLIAAAVPVSIKLYTGVTHEFFGMVGLVNEATEAMNHAAADLRAAFDKGYPPAPDEALILGTILTK